jgi:hypothetical protein
LATWVSNIGHQLGDPEREVASAAEAIHSKVIATDHGDYLAARQDAAPPVLDEGTGRSFNSFSKFRKWCVWLNEMNELP